MNSFVSSQFNYCPLLWMCHCRTIHTQINKIHERDLRIVYKNEDLSFDELLEKSGSVSIHYRNLQLLAVEIFKALNNLSSPVMSGLSKIKETKYNLRYTNGIVSNKPHTTMYGLDSVSYLAPKIWEQIPTEIRNCKTLNLFKVKIKTWVPAKCPCRLCKVYVSNVGYID